MFPVFFAVGRADLLFGHPGGSAVLSMQSGPACPKGTATANRAQCTVHSSQKPDHERNGNSESDVKGARSNKGSLKVQGVRSKLYNTSFFVHYFYPKNTLTGLQFSFDEQNKCMI
jgi:hypothetical protein